MTRICLGLAFVAASWGQGDVVRLKFEVASVKTSGNQGLITRSQGGPGTNDQGRWRAANAELSMLVMRAYGIDYDQLQSPSWMERTQFDVVANVPPGATAEQFRKMLQNLLAERFQLRVHHEPRTTTICELKVAKNGPKLKTAAQGSGADDFVPGSGIRGVDRDDFPVVPPGRPSRVCQRGPNSARCTFRMLTMGMLAQTLSLPNALGRRVVDKTGLAGQYDFTLYYSSLNGSLSAGDDIAPGIEQAVQDQLGLKLTTSKATIDVLVIDHAEQMPTAN